MDSEKRINRITRAFLGNYLIAILLATIVALFIRLLILEAFRVPVDFMSPGLLPGDHIFVNKLAYKPSIFTEERIPPERGDVIVFNSPTEQNKDFLKRVIAISGDRISIKNGEVFINGKSIKLPSDDPLSHQEQIADKIYSVLWKDSTPESRNMIEVTVPQDKFFVLGDHRARGQDSRNWGFLSQSYIKGKALIIWFSIEGGWTIRWNRIFKKVI